MAQGKKIVVQKQAPLRKSLTQSPFTITSNKYFIPAILFLLCFLLYGNTLHNGYAWDDIFYSNNDFIIKGFSAFKDILDKGSLYGFNKDNATQYRPLTLLNLMTEVSIFGLNPHVSHFFNVLLFAFTVEILYFFCKKF
jgi:protein O-mannosyl-transferase